MKKIIITVLASILITSTAAFAGSIQVGAKISSAFVDASGTETTTVGSVTGGAANSNSASVENNFVAIPSVYAEYSFDDASYASEGNAITIGVDYVFGSADEKWSGPDILLSNVKCFSTILAPSATARVAALLSFE